MALLMHCHKPNPSHISDNIPPGLISYNTDLKLAWSIYMYILYNRLEYEARNKAKEAKEIKIFEAMQKLENGPDSTVGTQ